MDNKSKANLAICSVCQGNGRINNAICNSCHGLGSGLVIGDKFIFFSLPVSMASIYLRRLRQTVFYIMDIIIWLFGLLGTIVFLYLLALTFLNGFLPDIKRQISDSWFQIISSLSWLALIIDLFVLYRYRRKVENKLKFNKGDYLPFLDWDKPIAWSEAWQGRKKINAALFLSDDLLSSLEKAYLKSFAWDQGTVLPVHLFAAILSESQTAGKWLKRLQLNGDQLFEKLMRQIKKQATQGANDFSAGIKVSIVIGYALALVEEREGIEVMDIILPLVKNDKLLAEVLYDSGVDDEKIENLSEWYSINERMKKNRRLFSHLARFKPSGNMDRAYTAQATPILDSVSYDLTAQAKYNRLEICVEREREINEIMSVMLSGQLGLLLVGQPGAGKRTVIGGLAQLMVMEKVPGAFRDKRLIEIDIARLIGGVNPAEAQERMLEIINEIARAGNIIAYIPNIETILGLSAGGESSLDLSEIVVNALQRGWFYCLATTTLENYQKFVEGSTLGKSLNRIDIDEPETNSAIKILESKVAFFEARYGVYLSYSALEQAVVLTKRFDHEAYLPDKAIKIIDKVAAKTLGEKGSKAIVSSDDVANLISSEIGVPVSKFTESEGKELLALEEKMHERMVGQDEAVNMVAAALRRARAELREGKRPIASFLFLGPTGVGKTELAKTLASVYFGAETAMIRLDMSEYQSEDALEKMIGSADGSLGYLTEKVREMPFSLVLLDEIEKAHPKVLDLFLQVMDDGRLTDGDGRTIDFTNSIIIATSNVGAVDIMKAVERGDDLSGLKEKLVENDLTKVMRPEFINRFDGIIVFKPLTIENVAQIAGLMIDSLAKMLDQKGIKLEISEQGLIKLAKMGYEPQFGARPLRRLLQDKIENVIANTILAGEVKRRDTIVINDEAEVQVQKAQAL